MTQRPAAIKIALGAHLEALVRKRREFKRRQSPGIVCDPLEARIVLSTAPVNPYVIDLLVVYTQQAEIERGGDANIQHLIQDAVDTTNQALYNSLIPITIRLVHTEQIDYTTSGDVSTDRARLQDPADGYLDTVPALRDQWGADLVSLITNDAGSGGNGSEPVLDYAQNDTLAFSAIDENSISDSNLTMAHELGHNLGAGHERNNLTQPADGIYPYSYGYRFLGADGIVYHDIMSYDPGLGIPYYANPAVTYAGAPEGKNVNDPQSADLATTFTLTAPMISAYRPTAVADTTGPSAAITSESLSGNLLTFTVQYKDDEAVDASSLGSNDVYVATPEGFNLAAQLLSVDRPGNAYAKTATYRVTLPNSNPPLASLHFMLRAGEVKDINGNFSPAGEIATNRADQAGWDFRTARNLGVLPPAISMTDSLGEGDDDDIYKFSVAARSIVDVSLTGMTGDADCYFVKDKNGNGLYDPTQDVNDSTNEYLDGSYNINGGDRSFAITLDPGTYYLWTYLQTTTTASTPYTITFENYTDSTRPVATLDASDLTTDGALSKDFAVTYTDDHNMDAFATRYSGAVDIHVALDDGFDYDMYWYPDPDLNPAYAQNSRSMTIFYRIIGPDGGYSDLDNGTYTITPHDGDRAADSAGNQVPTTPIGSYRVAIGVPDPTSPTASATLPPILVPGGSNYDFTVDYADGGDFDSNSISSSNIRVTGPNGFNQLATLVGQPTTSAGGSIHTATYRISAPLGSWSFKDDGPYTVSLLPSQVKDQAGNYIAAQPLGTINVHVPFPGDANNDDKVTFADLVAVAQNYGGYGKGIASGDFNFDGVVSFADLVAVAQHYGASLPPPVFPASIPTPAPIASLPVVVQTPPSIQKPIPVFATVPIKMSKAKPARAGIALMHAANPVVRPTFSLPPAIISHRKTGDLLL